MSEKGKRKLSGNEFKKKRLARENEQKKMSSSLQKFFSPSTASTSRSYTKINVSPERESNEIEKSENEQDCEITETVAVSQKAEEQKMTHKDFDSDYEDEKYDTKISDLDLSDPANWRNVSSTRRQIIIEKGAIQVRGIDFPKDDNGRQFSESLYER